jgi:hypothetical protein
MSIRAFEIKHVFAKSFKFAVRCAKVLLNEDKNLSSYGYKVFKYIWTIYRPMFIYCRSLGKMSGAVNSLSCTLNFRHEWEMAWSVSTLVSIVISSSRRKLGSNSARGRSVTACRLVGCCVWCCHQLSPYVGLSDRRRLNWPGAIKCIAFIQWCLNA